MRVNLQYKNFTYSGTLTRYITDLVMEELKDENLTDQELVEIQFFRPRKELGVLAI